MTGLEVLEELRLMNPSVQVIFSSGYALDGDAGPLLESGALAFVAKPYRPQDLVAAVRTAAEG
jgi:CheY-like chemotaxis protein